MENSEPQANTEIVEEKPQRPDHNRRVMGYLIGIGACLLVLALFFLVIALKKRSQDPLALGADDREQQRYDAEQAEQARNKASQIQNDSFLLRKSSDAEVSAQVEGLLRDLNRDGDVGAGAGGKKDPAKAEEDLIAKVIRGPQPQPSADPSYFLNRPQARSQPAAESGRATDSDKPMFVYSRSFGGAKYLDLPKQQPSARNPPSAIASPSSTSSSLAEPKTNAARGEHQPALLYTEHPPVTLYEGEVLEAVLVNRIIADTEPAPVICHLSKDVFDNSGRYVVFPANSRIVGTSQVVNYKGAHRLFISFHRIILPNGPSVDFPQSSKALKALDETGALGVVSKLGRHWWLQFGTAIFVGVLEGLGAAAQRSGDLFSRRAIIIDNTSRNSELILDRIMEQYSNVVPTITVYQGKKLRIYLSDDLVVTPYARTEDRSYAAH